MKVILLENLEKLGKKHSIIEVKDGFARNFLIPQGKALPVTPKNLSCIENIKKKEILKKTEEKKEAEEMAAKLKNYSVDLAVKVNENDEPYGAISAQQISDALQKEGFKIDKKCVILNEPIKQLGVFECLLRLHPEVETVIKVWVVKEKE